MLLDKDDLSADQETLLNIKRARSPRHYPWGPMVIVLLTVTLNSYAISSLDSILVWYLSNSLKVSEEATEYITPIFAGIYYLMAPIAGFLADLQFGNYHTQLWSYWMWCLGAVILFCTTLSYLLNWIYTITGNSHNLVFITFGCIALALQAMGYGMIRSIQSVLVADQFDPVGQSRAQANSFSYFYFSLTLGNLAGQIFGPLINTASTEIERGIAAGLTLLATFVLLIPRKRLIRKQPKKEAPGPFLPKLAAEIRDSKRILVIFAFMPLFYACFYQLNSAWVDQAARMNLTVVGNTSLPSTQIPTLQAFFVLLQIPLFLFLLYPLARRFSFTPSPLRRIVFGFFCTVLSIASCATLQYFIERDDSVQLSFYWQLPQLWLMATAETTVIITTLAFAYDQTPPKRRNIAAALFSVSSALGALLAGAVQKLATQYDPKHPSIAYLAYAIAMLACTVGLIPASIRYRYVIHPERESDLLTGSRHSFA